MTEKFKIINNAGDYHLMNGDEELCYDLCSPTMMQDNWNKVVDKLNKQEKTIKELNQYCIACDDTLTTIIELVDELLSMTTINHTLISKALKAIHNVDLKEMNQVKYEILKINRKDIK